MILRPYVELLGYKAKDKVTGFEGVITSVTFDLYGCVQALLTSEAKGDDGRANSYWFDVQRLKIDKKKRVMPVPEFGENYLEFVEKGKGPQDKPEGMM